MACGFSRPFWPREPQADRGSRVLRTWRTEWYVARLWAQCRPRRNDRKASAPGSKASKHHADTEGFIRLRSHGLSGWWLGLRTGLTFADRYGVRPSLGIDTGVSWLIARRIYAGASVGAKKVFLLDDDSDLRYNPSFRVAAGYAF